MNWNGFCEYLASDRDYVIAQVLAMAFKKDKGFQEWQRNHPSPEFPSESTGDRGHGAE